MLIMLSIAFLISLTLAMFILTSSNNFTNGAKLSLFSFRIVVALCILQPQKIIQYARYPVRFQIQINGHLNRGPACQKHFRRLAGYGLCFFSFSEHSSFLPSLVTFLLILLMSEKGTSACLAICGTLMPWFSKSMTKLSFCCLFRIIVTFNMEMPVSF